MLVNFHDPAIAAQFEELRQLIAAECAAEEWAPGSVPAACASSASLRRIHRLLQQRRDAEALEEMARFVRLSRLERGENVIPFPGRPRRADSTPADSPPAA